MLYEQRLHFSYTPRLRLIFQSHYTPAAVASLESPIGEVLTGSWIVPYGFRRNTSCPGRMGRSVDLDGKSIGHLIIPQSAGDEGSWIMWDRCTLLCDEDYVYLGTYSRGHHLEMHGITWVRRVLGFKPPYQLNILLSPRR